MFKNLIPWRRKSEPERTIGELATMPAFRQLERMRADFDGLLNRLYRGDPWADVGQWDVGWGCDVEDAESEMVVRAEAPGFDANDGYKANLCQATPEYTR